jgi:hypothetical protein
MSIITLGIAVCFLIIAVVTTGYTAQIATSAAIIIIILSYIIYKIDKLK